MSELYHVKQQFTLGAYKAIVNSKLLDASSPDHTPILIYHARSHIALNDPASALSLIPASEDAVLRALSSLARYVGARDTGAKEAALEELRDLCVEMDGEEHKDKGLVKVLAGTAFVRAGEIEEALETLGAGTDSQNLEAVATIVQIYLSIHRADLAKKEFDRAKRWAEDDLLLQLIESSLALLTGKDAYAASHAFYTEQLGHPSLTSPHLLTARGVTRLLRGDPKGARSDLEEALADRAGDAETLAALVVAAGLGAAKHAEAEELWSKMTMEHPTHPMVIDVASKAAAFDELASKFDSPVPV